MNRIAQALAMAAAASLAGCATGRMAHYDPPPEQPLSTGLTTGVAEAALRGAAPALALRITQSVLRRHPGDAEALETQGDAQYALGRPADAAASYGAALRIRPGSARSQTGLGRLALATDPETARLRLAAAARSNPGYMDALVDLGVADDLTGRHAEAQASYRRALAISPADVPARTDLAVSIAVSGNGEEAAAMLRPIASNPLSTAKERADYALALAIAGRTEEARRALSQDLDAQRAMDAVRRYREIPEGGAAIP